MGQFFLKHAKWSYIGKVGIHGLKKFNLLIHANSCVRYDNRYSMN